MRPTYRPGGRPAVGPVDAGEIRRVDVVLVSVAGPLRGRTRPQRVIGLGGDRVESSDGTRVAVNGKGLTFSTVRANPYVAVTHCSGSVGPHGFSAAPRPE
ncbi:S26 family signal peptidase [Streptomyces sp. NPDC054975]